MDIKRAELAELGRFIASRTAWTEAAAIARSTAPQLRYDFVAYNVIADPQKRAEFTRDELAALADRIADDGKRAAARRQLEALCVNCGGAVDHTDPDWREADGADGDICGQCVRDAAD